MERIFIWGTGNIATRLLDQCDISNVYDILGFIDNDHNKQGNTFRGKKIFTPTILYKIKPDKIVILTDFYEEIKQQIVETFPELEARVENKNFFFREVILKRYEYDEDVEIQNILNYIKNKDLQMFNYDFLSEYKKLNIDVNYDSKCRMFYIYHKNKKLYFARYLDTEEKVREYYSCLLIEQDHRSPHKYLDTNFSVEFGDIVVDVGTAEGNFSLEVIEKASKIYLIEAEDGWIDALRETFKDYQEKIVIIQKYITSVSVGKYSTLDYLIDEPVNFIKMDIEGCEWDGLLGAKKLIARSDKLKCAICSYHSDYDEILIKDILEKYGLKCSTTPGYLWWVPSSFRHTYMSTKLCRGIVRGIKKL